MLANLRGKVAQGDHDRDGALNEDEYTHLARSDAMLQEASYFAVTGQVLEKEMPKKYHSCTSYGCKHCCCNKAVRVATDAGGYCGTGPEAAPGCAVSCLEYHQEFVGNKFLRGISKRRVRKD